MKLGNGIALLCTLAVLTLAVGTASAQNILTNGDFEAGDLSGWVVAGGNVSATVTIDGTDNGPSAAGSNNAFMNNTGEALGLTLKQTTAPGTAGEGTVNYSFDLKLDQADVGGVFFVEIFAEQSGVGIIGGTGNMGPYFPPFGTWESFSGSFEAPAGTDFITIQFVAVTGADPASSCVAHVDNVVVDQGGSVPNETMSVSGLKAQHQ